MDVVGNLRRVAAALLVSLLATSAAGAPAGRPSLPYSPEAPYRAALLMDADSGEVFFAHNENMPWPPASMVKMMTVLIAMEQVKAGAISLDDMVTASAWASQMGGSQVYLAEGEQFPLRDMLKAIMISSANDASVAVAERIAGSTDAFVEMMNARARELGMTSSEFHSVHGLPPGPGQKPDLMSAADLAKLARKLMEFPEVREWAATTEAPFRDGKFIMRNTNHLVRNYRGATGLKTGYYAAAGFEVTATASRDGLNLIAVVLGAPTKKGCFDEAAKLLSKGFASYRAVQPVKAGQSVGAQIAVARGKERFFTGEAARDLRLVLPRQEAQQVKVEVKVPAQVDAPVAKGQVVGEIIAVQGDKELTRIEVLAPKDIERTSWWLGWF